VTNPRTFVYDPAILFKARCQYITICCRLMMSRADAKANKAVGLWMAYLSALLASYSPDWWWGWILCSVLGLSTFGLAEQRYQNLKNETPEALIAFLTQDFEQLIATNLLEEAS